MTPLGRTSGASLALPRLHPEGRKRVRIPQRFGGREVYCSHPVQQLRDVMRLRKLDLALNQESLQIFSTACWQ